jgi:hypothetical protein
MTIRIDGTNTAANPGITGTDTDTGLQFGTDEVKIVTGGTTRATVDSSGNLGLGTTSPAEELHINSATPSIRLSDTAGSNLITRITNSQGDLYFDADFGGTTGDIIFRSNGTLGRWVAGGGLAFGADTAAVNQLDDYEEGEWSPVLQYYNGSNWTDITFDSGPGQSVGRYVKIGRMVTVNYYSSTFNVNSSAVGNIGKIRNLPYPVDSTSNSYSVVNFHHTNCFTNASSGGYFNVASTTIDPVDHNSVSTSTWKDGTVWLMLSGTYFTT